MEYAELLLLKKKAIAAFFECRQPDHDGLPVSVRISSFIPLRDSLRTLDKKYEEEYKAEFGDGPANNRTYSTKIFFVDLLKDKDISISEIAYILDYDRHETGWILSEPGNNLKLSEASLKAFRDAYAIFLTDKKLGYIEGFVESFSENFSKAHGVSIEKGRLIAARFLLEEGYEASLITYATGIRSSEINGV